MKLNLSEDWKRAYSDYLLEEEAILSEDIDNTLLELNEAQQESQAGFSMLREYYEVFALTEGVVITENLEDGEEMGEDGSITHYKASTKDKGSSSKVEYTKSKDTAPTVTASMLKSLMSTVADGISTDDKKRNNERKCIYCI